MINGVWPCSLVAASTRAPLATSQEATSRLPASEAKWSGVTALASKLTPAGKELLERIAATLVTSLLRIASLSSLFQLAFSAASAVKHEKQKLRITSRRRHSP